MVVQCVCQASAHGALWHAAGQQAAHRRCHCRCRQFLLLLPLLLRALVWAWQKHVWQLLGVHLRQMVQLPPLLLLQPLLLLLQPLLLGVLLLLLAVVLAGLWT